MNYITFTCYRCQRPANTRFVNCYILNSKVPSTVSFIGYVISKTLVCGGCARPEEIPLNQVKRAIENSSIIYVDFINKKKQRIVDVIDGNIYIRDTV